MTQWLKGGLLTWKNLVQSHSCLWLQVWQIRINPIMSLCDHTVATTTLGFIFEGPQAWNLILKISKPSPSLGYLKVNIKNEKVKHFQEAYAKHAFNALVLLKNGASFDKWPMTLLQHSGQLNLNKIFVWVIYWGGAPKQITLVTARNKFNQQVKITKTISEYGKDQSYCHQCH